MFVQQNSNVESIVPPTDDPLHEPLLQTPSNSSAEFTTTPTIPSDSPNTESLNRSMTEPSVKGALMGRSGGKWCNLSSDNIIDTKRRATKN